jgi:AcrR family transcriptional regulator
VTQVTAHHGYAQLTVGKVLAAASVSRATFYQYFSNAEDCFGSAYRGHADQLVSDVTSAARGGRPLAALDALLATVRARPQVGTLLLREGLAAGPAGLAERDALVARIGQVMTGSAAEEWRIDLPAAILIGATFRFLAMRLTDGGALDGVDEQLREWVGAFAWPPSRPSCSARLVLPESSHLPRHPAQSPEPPRGPRERILRATAVMIRESGYRDVSVADIVAAAGLSRRAFYSEFASKADAFVAAYEDGFQQVLAACTPAFFVSGPWPERVWQCAQAFTRFMAREPLIAYLGFVECYAIGPGFASRVHDTQLAFTVFLEEGYRQRPEAQSPSRACSTLTAAAIFELGFQVVRRSPSIYLRQMQPSAVYLALAPFIGADEAARFVAAKLAANKTAAARAA